MLGGAYLQERKQQSRTTEVMRAATGGEVWFGRVEQCNTIQCSAVMQCSAKQCSAVQCRADL